MSASLAGRCLLVSAGPTYEDIDPVRFLGNRSSGKQGYALAEVAAARGAQVVLLMDCCHSGHITRTLDEQRPLARQCPPDQRARPAASLLGNSEATSPASGVQTRHILLAACRDEQLANEYRPPELPIWRGALTYFFLRLCQRRGPATTWADLYDQIVAEVTAIYPNQTPQLEGDGQRLLFGEAGRQMRGYLIVLALAEPNRIKVSGGAALGLSEGSQLAVFEPESRLTGRPLCLATVATAAISPQLVPVTETKAASPVVMVRALTLVRLAANKYSFQAKIQLKMKVIASPGATKGATTRVSTVQRLAPSTKAASSSSIGTPSMIPFINQTAKGRLKTQ